MSSASHAAPARAAFPGCTGSEHDCSDQASQITPLAFPAGPDVVLGPDVFLGSSL